MQQRQQQSRNRYDQMRKNLSFGIQQQLLIMLHKIVDKKVSQIFRQPVNIVELPDYYLKIKSPTDLSTIITKLKQGKYIQAIEIKKQLELMISNCKIYNSDAKILSLADKLAKFIEKQWSIFQKQLNKANIDVVSKIVMTQKVVNNFTFLQQKEKNRKSKRLIYNQLDLTKEEARNILERASERQNMDIVKQDLKKKQNKYFQFKSQKYCNFSENQKQKKMNFAIQMVFLKQLHEKYRLKKVQKYKKLIANKMNWINEKIIQKCLQSTQYSEFQSLKYLRQFIQNGQMASRLQVKKIQQYIKMVAYWIKDYQEVLSNYMKDKFIMVCQEITKCIFRVIRFINVNNTDFLQRSHQSQENQGGIAKNILVIEETKSQFIKKTSTKPYDQIKQFKKLMQRDLLLTNKKYLTIYIRCQDGVYSIANNWALKDFSSRYSKKRAHLSKYEKQLQDQIQRQRIKKAQFQEDLLFVQDYNKKNCVNIIQKYGQILIIDMQTAKLKTYPMLEFKFQNNSLI